MIYPPPDTLCGSTVSLLTPIRPGMALGTFLAKPIRPSPRPRALSTTFLSWSRGTAAPLSRRLRVGGQGVKRQDSIAGRADKAAATPTAAERLSLSRQPRKRQVQKQQLQLRQLQIRQPQTNRQLQRQPRRKLWRSRQPQIRLQRI